MKMRLSLVFVTLAGMALCCFGQTSATHLNPDDYRAVPVAFAPAEILRQITRLQQQRDESADNQAATALDQYVTQVWRALGLPDNWNGRCTCTALMLEDDAHSRYVTLRVMNGDSDYRFIAFLAPRVSTDSWRLLGYADTQSKYATPSHRIYAGPVGTFLIASQDTGGTGEYDENEVWYELTPGGARQVLKCPVKGHQSPFFNQGKADGKSFGLTREWEATSHPPVDEREPVVRVDLTARYGFYWWDDGKESGLFTRKQTAIFRWDSTSRTFRFDAQKSSLTQEEFEAAYGYELNLQQFIRYNADELRKSPSSVAAALLRQKR